MESGWVGDRDPWRTFVSTPRSRRGLRDYLLERPVLEASNQDDWKDRCRDSFQATAYALCALAKENIWPEARWRDALQAWSEEKLLGRSWHYMAPALINAPKELLQSLAHGISWWLQANAKTFDGHETSFLELCRRVLALDHQGDVDTDEPVTRAINHPVGHVTEALLRWWYRRSLEDGQGLPCELSQIFTNLCDTSIDKFRHGRVLLAAHVIAVFRVDGEWTTKHLLPLFDWHRSEAEAWAAWEGFLWSPRLYRPLLEAIKAPFLDTARNYATLGQHGSQYANLLTFAALDPGETFTKAELAVATRTLPADGLHEAAQALVRALEGAGEQRAAYWTNRLVPYLQSIWPKSREHVTPAISESLSHLCVAAREAFPQALTVLRGWLQPAQYTGSVVRQLHKAGLCSQFPEPALAFLSIVIGDQTQWPPTELHDCLEAIRTADPTLADDARFDRLMAYLRRHRGA